MNDEKFVYVRGVLSIMRPDIRQYKQQSIEIKFEQEVVVKVPIEFAVFDGEEFALTPEGVLYVQNEFEKLFNAEVAKVETEWDVKPKETEKKSDDGWDEVLEEASEKVSKKAEKKEVDEDWGDDPTFTDDESEEDSNKPDEEVWNEDDEEWK